MEHSPSTDEHTGLTSTEAAARLEQYGPNDVVEQTGGWFKQYITPLYSPISLMLLGAAILSYIDGKVFDFYFILGMYIVNYGVQKWQEFKADKAIKELQDRLSFDVHTLRDGDWTLVDAKALVPGDRIRLGLGSIIPADGTVINCSNLSVNEAVLTGESLPKSKDVNDTIFSGSFIAAGNLEAVVDATGKNTDFGKTIFSIEESTERSILEKDILSISRFLMYVSLVAVAILTVYLLVFKGQSFFDLLTLDLSLIIAGIPIAMPTVMAIILSIGATGLGRKQVVVRRLSALQDLANVNLVLTDKTGTLTKNEISAAKVVCYADHINEAQVIAYAYNASSRTTPDAIDTAIAQKYESLDTALEGMKEVRFTPFDSDRKHSTAYVTIDGVPYVLSLGAPQVIKDLAPFKDAEKSAQYDRDIAAAAADGYRVLAVAIGANRTEEKDLDLIGLIYLADPLDETSKDTVAFMLDHGIDVKMVTGDNRVIAKRIAADLGLNGEVLAADELHHLEDTPDKVQAKLAQLAAFAEIMPKDKYDLVRACEPHFIVASTGDGINDLPALKTANVGIAVAGAVSALKSLADIVLLGHGLSLIRDAIIESRKIFVRLYNYSVYRISESFRLIMTILVLGLWYGSYPLVPLQIILLAFMNDIPIISMATDRVKISKEPAHVDARGRLSFSVVFGIIGVTHSLIFFFLMRDLWHLQTGIIQTMFFLKLTVSGHLLIFVVHTKERWFKFLPSRGVMGAILITQTIATGLAVTGLFMPAGISIGQAALVWGWSIAWMQVEEIAKHLYLRRNHLVVTDEAVA